MMRCNGNEVTRNRYAMCTSLPACLQRQPLTDTGTTPHCNGFQSSRLEVEDDGAAKESPYFPSRRRHGKAFLVQQYLQNISQEEENNNNDIKPEPKSDVAAEESPYFPMMTAWEEDFLVQQYLKYHTEEEKQ